LNSFSGSDGSNFISAAHVCDILRTIEKKQRRGVLTKTYFEPFLDTVFLATIYFVFFTGFVTTSSSSSSSRCACRKSLWNIPVWERSFQFGVCHCVLHNFLVLHVIREELVLSVTLFRSNYSAATFKEQKIIYCNSDLRLHVCFV
jgi:hypothetical protein